METIRAIVNAGADVNAANDRFGTPLCLAAIRRDLAAVEFLIEHNASVNKNCNMLGSAAHVACASGDLAVIRALHAAGSDWKASNGVCASVLCHLSQLAQSGGILEPGRSPTVFQHQSQSPGAIAVRFRRCEAVDFCLGLVNGLSVDEPWEICSSYSTCHAYEAEFFEVFAGANMTLLSLAMSTLDIPTAESLLKHDAHDSVSYPLWRGALAYALDATRLQTTNEADLDSAVKLLILHGVDINDLRSPDGWRAYDDVSFVGSWNLGFFGIDNSYFEIDNRDSMRAWHHDYCSGKLLIDPYTYVPERLLAAFESAVVRPSEGTTALMYTIYRKNSKSLAHCVEVLCNNGARVDARDKDGRSALSLAREHLKGAEKIEVERILLLHSDMRSVENGIGLTA